MLRAGTGRRGPFSGALVSPTAAFDPASLFASGELGYIVAGYPGGSSFYEEDTRVTLATSSGTDPVGAITDLSPNGNHLIQSTSANRPVFYSADGIRSWRTGVQSAVSRWMGSQTAVYATATFTVVSVYKYITQDGVDASPLVSTYNTNLWGSGGYCLLRAASTSDLGGLCSTGTAFSTITGATVAGSPAIAAWTRSGTGANGAALTSYDLAGAQIATATSTQDATPANPLVSGYGGSDNIGGVVEHAFQLVINRALTAQELSDLKSHLVGRLGAWA